MLKRLVLVASFVSTIALVPSAAHAQSVGVRRIDGGDFHQNTRIGLGVAVGIPGVVGLGGTFSSFGALLPGFYLEGTGVVMPGLLKSREQEGKFDAIGGFHALGAARAGLGWRTRGTDKISFNVAERTQLTAAAEVLTERAFYAVARTWLGQQNAVAGGIGYHTAGMTDSSFDVDGYGVYDIRRYIALNLEVLYALGDLRGIGGAISFDIRWTRLYANLDMGYISGRSDKFEKDIFRQFFFMGIFGVNLDFHVPPSGTHDAK